MKLALIIGTLRRAGAQRVVLDICRNIREDNFDVTVLFWRKGGFYKKIKNIPHVTLKQLRSSPNLQDSLVKKAGTFLKRQKEIENIHEKRRFDMVHSHLFTESIHCALIKRKFGDVKAISTKHNTNPWRKKWRYRILNKIINSYTDAVTACSRSVKKFIEAYEMGEGVEVIYNGVDLERVDKVPDKSHPAVDDSKFNIISVGRIERQKGYEQLLRVFSRFVKQQPNSILHIVGDGTKTSMIKRLSKDIDIYNNTYFHGERDDVLWLIKSCELFMLLSRWEGLGIAFIEAMACGVPVIGSRVDGVRELIENNQTGYLVDRDDIDSIVKIMNRLYGNAKLRDEMGSRAISHVSGKFSSQEMTKNYEKLYKSV